MIFGSSSTICIKSPCNSFSVSFTSRCSSLPRSPSSSASYTCPPIRRSPKIAATQKRIQNINDYLTYRAWFYSTRGLYEDDKLMFTLLMALRIDLRRGKIRYDEFEVLIKGGASLDLNTCPPKPFRWLNDISWLNLLELSRVKEFHDVVDRVRSQPLNRTLNAQLLPFRSCKRTSVPSKIGSTRNPRICRRCPTHTNIYRCSIGFSSLGASHRIGPSARRATTFKRVSARNTSRFPCSAWSSCGKRAIVEHRCSACFRPAQIRHRIFRRWPRRKPLTCSSSPWDKVKRYSLADTCSKPSARVAGCCCRMPIWDWTISMNFTTV